MNDKYLTNQTLYSLTLNTIVHKKEQIHLLNEKKSIK